MYSRPIGHLHLVALSYTVTYMQSLMKKLLKTLAFFFRFRATLYPCPDTAAERREMAIGVNTRIEDLQTVSTLFYLFRRKSLQLQSFCVLQYYQ